MTPEGVLMDGVPRDESIAAAGSAGEAEECQVAAKAAYVAVVELAVAGQPGLICSMNHLSAP